jgi:hypothetical protein
MNANSVIQLTQSVPPNDQPKAQIGEQCAGFAGIMCTEGLFCVLPPPPSVGTISDQAGICQNDIPKAGLGEMCGGIVGIQCTEGLACAMPIPEDGNAVDDESGICERATSTATQTLTATTATGTATSTGTNSAFGSTASMMLVTASLFLML